MIVNELKCEICNGVRIKIFSGDLLKYRIDYFECQNCELINTEEPYWLNEAYKKPINIEDTGLLARNIYLSKVCMQVIRGSGILHGKYLDVAGGYGILTRLMRDRGYSFYSTDRYTANIFSQQYHLDDSDTDSQKYDLITCFEAFEHFRDPLAEFKKLAKKTDRILISTLLISSENKNNNDWWYYGKNHGQHITFYTKKTFEVISRIEGFYYYTNNRNIHYFSKIKESKIKIFLILKFGHYYPNIFL